MKFFYALETERKFVLSCVTMGNTKQNIPHNPGKYTQPTLLHRRGNLHRPGSYQNGLFNQFYMYICYLLKVSKRYREIFAMAVLGVTLMLLVNDVCEGFLGKETTLEKGEYTLLHGCR